MNTKSKIFGGAALLLLMGCGNQTNSRSKAAADEASTEHHSLDAVSNADLARLDKDERLVDFKMGDGGLDKHVCLQWSLIVDSTAPMKAVNFVNAERAVKSIVSPTEVQVLYRTKAGRDGITFITNKTAAIRAVGWVGHCDALGDGKKEDFVVQFNVDKPIGNVYAKIGGEGVFSYVAYDKNSR